MTDPEQPGHGALVEVRLLGLSLAALRRASEHTDELRREFAIMRINDHQGVPARLLTLMAELDDRYGSFTASVNDEIDAATARGASAVDLVFELPSDAGDAARRLAELLDEADDYCREGADLLTLATPRDVIAFRRWYLGEVVRQSSGQPPISWPDHVAHGDGPVPSGVEQLTVALTPRGGEILFTITGDIDLAVTDELRGRFLDVHDRPEATVVVNLAGVGFMDSTGLSVLISAWKRLQGEDRELILQDPTPPVLHLLRTCGLTDLFKMRTS